MINSFFLNHKSATPIIHRDCGFSQLIHDVTPSVVPSAVRIDISTCTINFQVSFFIISLFYYEFHEFREFFRIKIIRLIRKIRSRYYL